MLTRAQQLIGYKIAATDGEFGKVSDIYFDDHSWTVRYFIVDTGGWISGRLVLVSPESIVAPDDEAHTMRVSLTKQQIEAAPSVDTEKPVSRQQEIPYREYFGWPPYWSGFFGAGAVNYVPLSTETVDAAVDDQQRAIQEGDPNMRSVDVVSGYHIRATDGDIGHIDNFLIDSTTWAIRYAVVDTHNWLPGKKILLALDQIDALDWATSEVDVHLTRARIQSAPEFDASHPLDTDYEKQLRQYYEAA